MFFNRLSSLGLDASSTIIVTDYMVLLDPSLRVSIQKPSDVSTYP